MWECRMTIIDIIHSEILSVIPDELQSNPEIDKRVGKILRELDAIREIIKMEMPKIVKERKK